MVSEKQIIAAKNKKDNEAILLRHEGILMYMTLPDCKAAARTPFNN